MAQPGSELQLELGRLRQAVQAKLARKEAARRGATAPTVKSPPHAQRHEENVEKVAPTPSARARVWQFAMRLFGR